jgi:hypothetical protein
VRTFFGEARSGGYRAAAPVRDIGVQGDSCKAARPERWVEQRGHGACDQAVPFEGGIDPLCAVGRSVVGVDP